MVSVEALLPKHVAARRRCLSHPALRGLNQNSFFYFFWGGEGVMKKSYKEPKRM